MSARPDAPRDLLLGLLALQNGLIDQSELILAFHAWTRAGGRPMAEILAEQGAVGPEERSLLEALAARHLRRHGGDPERSLAAMNGVPSTLRKLASLAHPDLEDSLTLVGTPPPDDADDPYRTASRGFGDPTSAGQRFRALRPHARGGLGEVWVALDVELNREVALKRILDRHADNPAFQAKFLVEAEITGGLEHPGIVPVYGLGRHSDGRPYYAMRFVRGDNLKETIERSQADAALRVDPGARSLALRKLLRRFVDVCNAIEYAHSRGILHRDIKPGNVIVGRHGETLVVDWGLAKPLGVFDAAGSDEPGLVPPSASGSAETLPGSAVGTPAYMSPEQAAGDLRRLGPRSDVYSLGATLYSILTGRVPFEGPDLGVVLRNVRAGEFPRPREVDPSIDPALEAVCLKAMAARPEDRHASARALAEDVERWSADEPVSAWDEPWSRRARRWARRHRTAMTAAAAATLAATVGLAGVLAVQARANGDLKVNNELLTDSNRQKDRANAELKMANEQVRARFDLAQESIHAYQAAVAEDQVLKDEQFRPLRDKLLRSAADFYGKLGALLEGQTDRRSRRALAGAYRELGELTAEIGVRPEALAIYRKEQAVRRELASEDEPEDVLKLAENLVAVGRLAGETGDGEGHRAAAEEARRLVEGESWPAALADQARNALADGHDNIGEQLGRTGDTARAMEEHRRALAIRRELASAHPEAVEFQADLAGTHARIGDLLGRIGQTGPAMEEHRQALAIHGRLAEARPGVPRFRANLASSHFRIGDLLERIGEPARALESHRRALEIRRDLAAANPAVTEYRAGLASGFGRIGNLREITGEPDRAVESHRRALEIRRRLVEANPDVTDFQANLAHSYGHLGILLGRDGEAARAMECFDRALEIQARLAAANPRTPMYQANLAAGHYNIGILLSNTGQPSKALESLGRALEILRRVTRDDESTTLYRIDLQRTLTGFGRALADLGRASEAVPILREARAMNGRLPSNPEVLYRMARPHALLAGMGQRPGSGLSAVEAAAEADRAMMLLGKAASVGYRSVRQMRWNKDFDALRRRRDFQELLMDMAFPVDPIEGRDAGGIPPELGQPTR